MKALRYTLAILAIYAVGYAGLLLIDCLFRALGVA